MHILITGAAGFVGAGLASRLQSTGQLNGAAITRLSLVDRQFDAAPSNPLTRRFSGDFADPGLLDAVLATPVDLAFHLASVPGGLAERDYELGRQVNLLATLALAGRLAAQAAPKARLVFASSVAVYGEMGSAPLHESTLPRPVTSYGTHKLMAELMLADLSRRGMLDARSLRLPGIVARPPAESGHGSAFMSLVFHRLARGEPYACPVGADASCWWMSLNCCLDNLLHAASLDDQALPPGRVFQLPVLRLAMSELVQALGKRFGTAGLTYRPDPRIEALFGRQPALETPSALAAGFLADADADALITEALNRMEHA
ncbi:NAD-dependent epimerase/dehydratase family protein [Pelomonas sp. KK5]|uniref:NAD-dependent epimerase/dehydratase family protein n=1 Tax=Pelomonas sp. KK5 TaxID=1855730 RepID=UPI00097BEAA7|nr:NAD-dependent epimerase/dehydratase family protein [Pelomonas sp. KK5]